MEKNSEVRNILDLSQEISKKSIYKELVKSLTLWMDGVCAKKQDKCNSWLKSPTQRNSRYNPMSKKSSCPLI